VFEKKNVDTLLKHWPYDCMIDLEEGVQPLFRPIYNLSQDKLVILHEYINENIEKRFIWHSKSPINALILIVKKKDGSLGMCVDYHRLNQLTVKNWYLLLLILRSLNRFNHVKMYTKIDLRGAYNSACIWKGDERKTTFCTIYGHFEYVMMPFESIHDRGTKKGKKDLRIF
jgi:hypothetical protein